MSPFSTLLSRALQLCNGSGKPIAAGVAVFGVVIIVQQMLLWQHVGVELMAQTRTLVGEERYAKLQTTLEREVLGSQDVQRAGTVLLQEIEKTFSAMPAVERERAIWKVISSTVQHTASVAVPLVLSLLLVEILAKAFFLILTARRAETITGASAAFLRRSLQVIGAWIAMWLCAGVWLPIIIFFLGFVWAPILLLALPSLIPIAIFLPRFLFAPVIVAQENKGIVDALRQSYARTKGRWWAIVSSMISMSVVVWILLTLVNGFLTFLIDSVTQYSVLGFALYWLVPFIALIAVAYRSAFAVILKEEIGAAFPGRETRARMPVQD